MKKVLLTICVLILIGAIPALGGEHGPFVEFQEVPIFMDSVGWCIQHTPISYFPDGSIFIGVPFISC